MKINDIITDETGSVYTNAAIGCNENNAMLEEIEAKDNIRRFKVVPVPDATDDEKKASVRIVRDENLNETDKYMLSDYPVSEEEREKYRAYRQYLRDYTQEQNWFENQPFLFEEWNEKNVN